MKFPKWLRLIGINIPVKPEKKAHVRVVKVKRKRKKRA